MKSIRVNLLGLVLISLFAVSCQAQRSEIAYSIKHGDLDTVKKLITENKGLLFEKVPTYCASNLSLLHWAIYNRQHEILEYLLKEFTKHDIDINKLFDSTGNNPLFYALEDADPSSLRLLIKFGVDITVKNKYGHAALAKAVFGHGSREKVLECFNILFKKGLRCSFSNDTLDFISKYEDKEIMDVAKSGMSDFAKARYALRCFLGKMSALNKKMTISY